MKRLSTLLGALLFSTTVNAEQPKGWQVEALLPPSPFHGVHGITVRADGTLLVGSVVGDAIYKVDRETGAVSTYRGAPGGMADDLEEGPKGTPFAGMLGFTGFSTGRYFLDLPDGSTRKLANGLPGMNSTAWNAEGRLFATQVFLGDALYELDPAGETPPRLIMKDMGGLNGFDFGPDGKLYGPLWFKGQIARVDVDAATLEVVADGFAIPAAANFNTKGELYVVDTVRGEVVRVDAKSGARTVVAKVKPAIDNLAFAPDNTLYITNMADNAVIEVDVETGTSKTLVSGKLAVAGGIAIDGNTLYVADVFSARQIDLASGTVSDIARAYATEVENPISVDARNGTLIVASWFSSVVQKLDPVSGKVIAAAHDIAAPMDVAIDPTGAVFVSEAGTGNILRLSSNLKTRQVIASGLQLPTGLAIGPDGALYVGEYGTGKVLRLDPTGGAHSEFATGLNGAEGFTFGPDGRLYVADVPKQRIIAIGQDRSREVIASGLPIGLPAAEGGLPQNIPTGLAFGPDGSLYVSADEDATIYKITQR
ncbi:MAG: hypothetical protein ACPG1C_06255 [Alphaproteobacteria bacterium]